MTYGFLGGTNTSGLFRIDPTTGVIRLIDSQVNFDLDEYKLNVTATDDGKCCVESGAPVDPKDVHMSTALVVVSISSNNHKPIFEDCASYAPKLEENTLMGIPVLKVQAVDKDHGINGQVKYSILQTWTEKFLPAHWHQFTIDEETGQIYTKSMFDRESDGREVFVTVKATDSSEERLEGICTVNVEILDMNDNWPIFERRRYVEIVRENAEIGTNILKVSASDNDASDKNGAIRYRFSRSSFNADLLEYFDMDPESGWISLKKPLDTSIHGLVVIAEDPGDNVRSRTVDVDFDLVDSKYEYPVWDSLVYGPFYVKENAMPGH